ncbi:MAG: 4Fe-4S dicluster domain-containing protein [Candidatus Methanofastidiosia archaeon]
MTNQLGFYIELGKCTGCEACTVACKSENNTPLKVNWRWVLEQNKGKYPNPKRVFVTMACFHCENPACLKSCPEDAITKRENDGIVLIDQEKCVGCKRCIWACPYGAPQFQVETEKVEKCTFCVQRIEEGLNPACVDTCVGRALHFGDIKEIARKPEAQRKIEGFANPDLTNPSVRFKL